VLMLPYPALTQPDSGSTILAGKFRWI
jgi:hypothetical protein